MLKEKSIHAELNMKADGKPIGLMPAERSSKFCLSN